MIIPVLLVGGGIAALVVLALSSDDGPVPVHEPDLPPIPGSTRYKKVDAILPELQKASAASGIPLGLLVGWVARESGGRLDETTKLDERGVFQLHPDESKSLGLDHKRLSTDLTYSINAGLLLIGQYMKRAMALGVAQPGTEYFWKIVKLCHTMGSGATRIIVEGAKAAGAAGSWQALEDHALDNEKKYLSATKHSPSKWFPLVNEVYSTGRAFGFGADSAMAIVGAAPAYSDIPDPLDCL